MVNKDESKVSGRTTHEHGFLLFRFTSATMDHIHLFARILYSRPTIMFGVAIDQWRGHIRCIYEPLVRKIHIDFCT